MFNREELHLLIESLITKFSTIENDITTSIDKVYIERKRDQQNELLTLLLKTINLSDTAK